MTMTNKKILDVLESVMRTMQQDLKDWEFGEHSYLAHAESHIEAYGALEDLAVAIKREDEVWPDFVNGDLV